ncbi:MAG: hypothetical protein NW237_16570 [Cyanobacteriota bacterium]|nr:hypothetical protein [Cyanobacteriota bacterium]
MAILIANIGTSDLAVKLQGFEYYIPVGFDRNEPNENPEELTEDENIIWERNSREDFIASDLCSELDVNVEPKSNGRLSYSFRELTEKLLAAYRQDPESWQVRIRLGRIWGVIHTAIEEFSVTKINIFVTDQTRPHHQDTCFLFEIMKMWSQRHLQREDILFLKRLIPKDIQLNQQDPLLNEYYRFFVDNVNPNEEVLVSIKGGTPQMQTALRLQSITANLPKLLFLDPVLSTRKVLLGEPSPCTRTSFWQYQRTQNYRVVKLLLERWDFSGAIQVLKNWRSILTFQIVHKALKKEQVRSTKASLEVVINGLTLADALLNLDLDLARSLNDDQLPSIDLSQSHSTLLNLYTQCRLYQDIDQIAHFLSRLSSCCEEILDILAEKLGGKKYIGNRGIVYIDKLKSDLINGQSNFVGDLDYSRQNDQYKIFSRKSKRAFVEILIEIRQNLGSASSQEISSWRECANYLDKLEYWIWKRNDLIHDGRGFSKQRIQELNEGRDQNACDYNEIIKVMSSILCSPLLQLPRQERQRFIEGDDYYLYTDIRQWIIDKLNDDMKMN